MWEKGERKRRKRLGKNVISSSLTICLNWVITHLINKLLVRTGDLLKRVRRKKEIVTKSKRLINVSVRKTKDR